jgi:hypothetical protein
VRALARIVLMPAAMRASSLLCTIVLITACQPSTGSGGDEEACEGPLGKPIPPSQLTAMTACCQAEAGKAHCLDDGRVPAELEPFVAACDTGGYCIPDNFLETGAAEPPATCTAFGGSGVCLSRCIPQVAENAGLLRKETCAGADELCVPCISPLDNMPTGACDLLELATCVGEGGKGDGSGGGTSCDDPATCDYDADCPPVLDPATLASCGADAHCVDPALVTDPNQKAQLGTCTGGTKLCVPDVFIRTGGKFTPATCSSVGGAEGRCLSRVLPAVKAQDALLPQDTCTANERCAPCYDPITGMSTGACNLSCDAGPKRAPVTFAQCCDARAHCVPSSSIPDDQEDNLDQDSCADTNLCVPDQILLGQTIPTCTASSLLLGSYSGVCLSDCFSFGIQGLALARGSCQSGFKCAPCVQNGQPTGAPGCPM